VNTLGMRNSTLNAAVAFGAHAELARAAHRDAQRTGAAPATPSTRPEDAAEPGRNGARPRRVFARRARIK